MADQGIFIGKEAEFTIEFQVKLMITLITFDCMCFFGFVS